MEKPKILIVATSLDEPTYGPVKSELESRDYSVITYRTDRVLSGEEQLFIRLTNDAELTMKYEGTSITPGDIGAGWYRKVAAFRPGSETDDQAKQLHIASEIRSLHDTIWSAYPEELWLNAPDRMRRAERKLAQLSLASELGFDIPPTYIANQWGDIRTTLLTDHDQVIAKTIRGIISEGNEMKAMYTKVLDEKKIRKLEDWTTPFPGLYQPYISKRREWRITVVGDKVFPAAIYTDKSASDDWRKHQLDPSVRFAHEPFPDKLSEKCLQFLGRLGLRFGAFDFIENHDSQITFLECNPNGQYGWLEQNLKLPISQSVALELIKLASLTI